jgi:hypothetical protein
MEMHFQWIHRIVDGEKRWYTSMCSLDMVQILTNGIPVNVSGKINLIVCRIIIMVMSISRFIYLDSSGISTVDKVWQNVMCCKDVINIKLQGKP